MKIIFFVIAAIAVLGIICAIVIVVVAKSSSEYIQDDSGTNVFEVDYSNTMRLYKALNGNTYPIADLPNEVKSLGFDANIERDEETGFITVGNKNESIGFTITMDEEDSPGMVTDFIYRETYNGDETFVIQSGKNTFQHFDGDITTEFDTIEGALNYHLSFHQS